MSPKAPKVGDIALVAVAYNKKGETEFRPIFVRVTSVLADTISYQFLSESNETEAGNCGSPVMDASGYVLGIHTGRFIAVHEGVGFAMTTTVLTGLNR